MRKVFLFSLLTLACAPAAAQAAPIGSTTFDGDIWTLVQINPTTFELTVDTDGSDAENYIRATAINLGGPSTGGSLASVTAPGSWAYVDGGTNSSGCNGSGAPYDCAQWTSGALAFDNGSIYSWTWTILNPHIDPTGDHLKAVYFDSKGTASLTDDKFAGLQMSLDIQPVVDENCTNCPDTTAVPEPASLLLVGAGLTVAGKIRNRRKKSS